MRNHITKIFTPAYVCRHHTLTYFIITWITKYILTSTNCFRLSMAQALTGSWHPKMI